MKFDENWCETLWIRWWIFFMWNGLPLALLDRFFDFLTALK